MIEFRVMWFNALIEQRMLQYTFFASTQHISPKSLFCSLREFFNIKTKLVRSCILAQGVAKNKGSSLAFGKGILWACGQCMGALAIYLNNKYIIHAVISEPWFSMNIQNLHVCLVRGFFVSAHCK